MAFDGFAAAAAAYAFQYPAALHRPLPLLMAAAAEVVAAESMSSCSFQFLTFSAECSASGLPLLDAKVVPAEVVVVRLVSL